MNKEPLQATLQIILGTRYSSGNEKFRLPIKSRVYLGKHGLESEDGVREFYDDTDCALMHYASEHYDFWRRYYPALSDDVLRAGLFGENFSTVGMTERNVCLGDIFQLGTAQLQVSWGRAACQKMAACLQDENAPNIMQQQSRNGWFYRVLVPGEAAIGDTFTRLESPGHHWPLEKIQALIFNHEGSTKQLEELVQLPYLAAAWKTLLESRLGAL